MEILREVKGAAGAIGRVILMDVVRFAGPSAELADNPRSALPTLGLSLSPASSTLTGDDSVKQLLSGANRAGMSTAVRSCQEAPMRANVNQVESHVDGDGESSFGRISESGLASVNGGEYKYRAKYENGNFDFEASKSYEAYRACVDPLERTAEGKFPHTWSWYNPFSWFTDGNAQPRAEWEQSQRQVCMDKFAN